MNLLIAGARSLLGLSLSPAQVAAFETYAALLLEWNARFNLTAITDAAGIQVKHFLDSLSCLLAIGRQADLRPGLRLVDVGTGAGFPGLPLKIACPQLHVTLVEATAKKAGFCQRVVEALSLTDVSVVAARAEQVGQDAAHRERYDWAVARAVASVPVLVEYMLPLVRLGGQALAQKGEAAPAEVGAVRAARSAAARGDRGLALLGGRLNRLVPVELPGVAEVRYLVVFDKVAATPSAYPRRAGVPAKKPLG